MKIYPLINQAAHHEDIWGSGGITPHILNLDTRWRWLVWFKSQQLCPQWKSPWYPLDMRLG